MLNYVVFGVAYLDLQLILFAQARNCQGIPRTWSGTKPEQIPVLIGRAIEGQAGEGRVGVDASKIERTRWVIVAFRHFRSIDQDRLAGADLHGVFPRSGINPNGLRNRGANGDLVVSSQRIDDDGQEIAFWRKKFLEVAQLDALARVGIEDEIGRFPDETSVLVLRLEIEL